MATERESDGHGTEYFANTNILSIRMKWMDGSKMLSDVKKSELLCSANDIVHSNKGVILNPKEMENYQYLSDSKRMDELEQFKEVYLFERGNKEYKRWYKEEEFEDKKVNWFYDVVVQARFKYYRDLEKARDAVVDEFSRSTGLECWSISENPHALNHPGNLYVRGIPKNLSKEDLLPVFGKFGPILELKIIMDSVTNESLGFGFVSYPLGSQASTCIKELNGNLMNGSLLFVNYHVERKERERIHLDQWRQIEEEDNIKFNGVFIGNLPIYTEANELVTPELVVTKFKNEMPDFEIVSYYFPRANSKSAGECSEHTPSRSPSSVSVASDSKTALCSEQEPCKNDADLDLKKDYDEAKKDPEVETNVLDNSSQTEDSPLKGYGFIRFKSHEMALKCIENFNDCQLFGNKLVVNKAVQKHHQHTHNHSTNSTNGNHMGNINSNSMSNISNGSSSNIYGGYNYPSFGSFYSYFPPVHMGMHSRRHSDRSNSSRKSSLTTTSSSSVTLGAAPQSHQVSHPSYNQHSPRSISRQNSYGQDQSHDPHSPLALPHHPLSTPIFPMPMHTLPGTALAPIIPQPMPIVANSPTVSNGSPRSKSMFAAHMSHQNLPGASHMFNTPLPIPRSDEQESNLYVKHLPLDWKDKDLHEFFQKFGEIISAKIITVGGSVKEQENSEMKKDELFGKSKGYGFVCFQNPLDASKAMYHTDGLKLEEDHVLFVSFAQRRSKSIDSSRGTSPTFNYNKKFLNAMYQQQHPKSLQKQHYNPWMMPVTIPYFPRSE